MRKRNHRKWYRHPKTTNERKQNQEEEFVRGRRHPQNLPTAYDDLPVQHPKTKKDYTKKKYKEGGRGKRHELILPYDNYKDYSKVRKIEVYLHQHNIPYRVEKVGKKYTKKYYIYKKSVPWKLVPRYEEKRKYIDGQMVTISKKQVGWQTKYREIKLDKPIEKCYTVHTTVAYKIVWWSDKDIGLEYLC